MAKIRVSTTVDEALLNEARAVSGGAKDSSLLERALGAYIASERAAVIDARIDVMYSELPLETADEWGDLGSFLDAANKAGDASAPR